MVNQYFSGGKNMTKGNNLILLPRPRNISLVDGSANLNVISAVIDPAEVPYQQGYKLKICECGTEITAHDDAGMFYAHQTLNQLQKQTCPLSAMLIEDWPDLLNRGIGLDLSRDKIPTMDELKRMIDRFASWKLNAVRLYFEHTFAYKDHEEVWRDASPLTAEECRELDDYCQERFIQLVPEQNSFGHLLRWLCHDRYRPLAECPDGFPMSWSMNSTDPFSLCPTDPRSIEFVESLWTELFPNFRSNVFSSGCDETCDIGHGRSKEEVEKHGIGIVYLDYIVKLNNLARKFGKTMMINADILFSHAELLPELPKDLILCDWGYRPDYDFESHAAYMQQNGIKFMIETSNSSYCSFLGRTYRWRKDIENGARAAAAHGAEGVLNWSFGDFGHWNDPLFNLPGDAFAAAAYWHLDSNQDIDLGAALDLFIFEADSGAGDFLLDVGKPYEHTVYDNDSDTLHYMMALPRFTFDNAEMSKITPWTLELTRSDLLSLLRRLRRQGGFSLRAQEVLSVYLEWMLLAVEVAERCLNSKANYPSELPLEERTEIKTKFAELRPRIIRLRDEGPFRSGGRAASLWWLDRFQRNLGAE
jgi:hypothetical protein